MQVVPAAICIETDQTPEAHRWYEFPSAAQAHSPSGVQAAPATTAPVVVLDDEGTDGAAEATEGGDDGATEAGDDGATGTGDTVSVAAAGEDETGAVPVAKPVADDPAAVEAPLAAALADGELAAAAAVPPQSPVNCSVVLKVPFANFSTLAPGSGYA